MKPLYQILEIAKEFLCVGFDSINKSRYICNAVRNAWQAGKVTIAEYNKAVEFIQKKIGDCTFLITHLKLKEIIPDDMDSSSKEYADVRNAWLQTQIDKLKKNIRKPQMKTSNRVVGDTVKIIDCPKAMAWGGWVEAMTDFVGTTGTIIEVMGTEAKVTGGNGYWFPISSLKKIS